MRVDHLAEVDAIDKLFGGWAGTRLNFATDAVGNYQDETGSSRGLNFGETDRILLSRFRRQSDLIITDAATARAEKYQSSKHAPIAVFSASGNFTGLSRLLEDSRNFKIVPAPIASVGSAASQDVFEPRLDLRKAFQDLKSQGFQQILLETGPNLSRQLIRQGLVGQMCLTTAKHSSTAKEQAPYAGDPPPKNGETESPESPGIELLGAQSFRRSKVFNTAQAVFELFEAPVAN